MKTLKEEIIGCKSCLGEWIEAKKLRRAVKRLKKYFNIYRESINEELSDERVLAHLHTCINKIDNEVDEIMGEFK